MAITIEAIYENGMLKLSAPLPLKEHEKVHVTINAMPSETASKGVVPCTNPQLIEWAALDAELDFPRSAEDR